MTIYEAEFLGDPTPIRTTTTATRKPKAKKQTAVEPVVDPTPAHIPDPDKVDTKGPVKKKRTMKKVAVVVKEPTPEPVPVPEPEKKKRKRTVKPKLPTPPPSDVSSEKDEEPPAKKPKKITKPKSEVVIDGIVADEPPSWFKKHLLEEAKRRNEEKEKKERVPATEIKKVATESAHKKWNDGFTRDKINNEVTTHMNRLYQQIHGRR